MKKIIPILILSIIALIIIINYSIKSNPKYLSTYINFNERLENLNSLSTKEDIYKKENRRPDETKKNDLYELLIYREKKANGYNGVLMYGIDENGYLKAISFLFSNPNNYQKFMSDFKKKYSYSYTKENNNEIWEGYTNKDIILLSANKNKSTIDILFLEDVIL